MGLDMYAYTVPKTAITEEVNFKIDDLPDAHQQLHYWRKHPNLHGWMRELYNAKGGEEVFNCEPVVLTLDDIAELETAIMDEELPPTIGFFFGESDGSEKEDDLAFIAKARAAIADGQAVIYSSWW